MELAWLLREVLDTSRPPQATGAQQPSRRAPQPPMGGFTGYPPSPTIAKVQEQGSDAPPHGNSHPRTPLSFFFRGPIVCGLG